MILDCRQTNLIFKALAGIELGNWTIFWEKKELEPGQNFKIIDVDSKDYFYAAD